MKFGVHVLFVGGPKDGDRLVVSEPHERFAVPEGQVGTVFYRLCSFAPFGPVDEIRHLYVVEGMSHGDALDMLLANYQPPRPVEVRRRDGRDLVEMVRAWTTFRTSPASFAAVDEPIIVNGKDV